MERRRHIESLRLKDMDRRQAVEERRKELEKTELERKEAIIQKNRERESRLETQRRHSRGSNLEFAFGSSAPRMMEPRVDSASGYWGSRRWAQLILGILNLHTTSDVEDRHGIDTKVLLVCFLFFVPPRVPGDAIRVQPASPQHGDDLEQGHVEVPREPSDPVPLDVIREFVPKLNQDHGPPHFHHPVIAVNTHDDDLLAQVAHVLFETHCADQNAAFGHLWLALLRVRVVTVPFEVFRT